MMEKIPILGFFFMIILCLATRDLSSKSETLQGDCSKAEREALLDFKGGLKAGASTQLSSWQVGNNCCQWEGIGCEKNTGAVVSINLRNHRIAYDEFFKYLSGEIRPSLLELKSLRYLDLSGNTFDGILIPEFLGSLKNLRYLNLSFSGFVGSIPPTLGNLSNLEVIDLSAYGSGGLLHRGDLEWLSGLVSLKILKMNDVYMSMVGSHWMEMINKLPLLTELHLEYCNLPAGPISSLSSINFTSLSVLNLGYNELGGKFPNWLLNLSSLVSVDLSRNHLYGEISSGLGELPNLQYLNLSYNENLTGSFSQLLSGSWKQIESLDFQSTGFHGTIPASIGKLSKLKYLNVRDNGLTGSLPEFLQEMNNSSNSEGVFPEMRELDLSQNQLMGRLPEWLSQLKKLKVLDLSENKFQGPIPDFGALMLLEHMRLDKNELNGSLPVSFGQLSELVELDISWNHLNGILYEQHFSKLSKLNFLHGEGNSGLVLNFSSAWIPPFQLTSLRMHSSISPSFPTWLRFQKRISHIDMSNASISDSIPDWLWKNNTCLPALKYLNLSSNRLQGRLPKQFNMTSLGVLDLSSNFLEGPIPLPINPGFVSLILSNNKFSGPIPPNIGESFLDINFLSLSNNQITGVIPKSIGCLTALEIIDLSRNSLIGSIPSSMSNLSNLMFLNLGRNNLSGDIPTSVGSLVGLESLYLNKNKLSGELPLSFKNLSGLEILDLSYNRLSGHIASLFGATFSSQLRVLKLRSNSFSGGLLPFGLSNLTSLHILDLADNNLSGSIPPTLGDLIAMSHVRNMTSMGYYRSDFAYQYSGSPELDKLIVKAKGQDLEYVKFLDLVASIDLSGNDFSGEFPKEITKLHGLVFLNLSRNHIIGSIPEDISMLSGLQSLDLSSNNLHGRIPASMSSLTFLSYLNLSNNNFSGKIPFTGQVTTFDEPAFAGNPHLCGRPLVAHCQGDDDDLNQDQQGQSVFKLDEGDDHGFIDQWFYLSIGLGFAVGILGPIYVLTIRKSWCATYFNLVDKIVNRLL